MPPALRAPVSRLAFLLRIFPKLPVFPGICLETPRSLPSSMTHRTLGQRAGMTLLGLAIGAGFTATPAFAQSPSGVPSQAAKNPAPSRTAQARPASPTASIPAKAAAPARATSPANAAAPVRAAAGAAAGAAVGAVAAPKAEPMTYATRPAGLAFIDRMVAQGMSRQYVQSALANARYASVAARAIIPPASPGVRVWSRYRDRFVEPQRIQAGLAFWDQNRDVLARAQAQYGVPASVIVSIIGVETFYGRVMGDFRILDALATLGFDFPSEAPRDRSDFFQEQLAEYLLLCQERGIDPRTLRGSFAGAIGLPQFMPGSIRRFAVASEGGAPDLINRRDDAVMSVANFLVEHGWQRGQPVFSPRGLPTNPAPLVDGGLAPTLDWATLQQAGAVLPPEAAGPWANLKLGIIDLIDGDTGSVEYRLALPNFFVITQYNRSYFYAASVADLAQALEQGVGSYVAPAPATVRTSAPPRPAAPYATRRSAPVDPSLMSPDANPDTVPPGQEP
jgi:membrane-bound lytic murein transglycosylase B